jgi:hypothetical protein
MIVYWHRLYHGSKMFTSIEEGMAALRSVLEQAKSKEGKINPETVTADLDAYVPNVKSFDKKSTKY